MDTVIFRAALVVVSGCRGMTIRTAAIIGLGTIRSNHRRVVIIGRAGLWPRNCNHSHRYSYINTKIRGGVIMAT